jgi:hypothetical protein
MNNGGVFQIVDLKKDFQILNLKIPPLFTIHHSSFIIHFPSIAAFSRIKIRGCDATAP